MKCCAKHIHNKKMAKIHAWNFLFINADKLFGKYQLVFDWLSSSDG